MALPLIPIAVAGAAWISKDVFDFFKSENEPAPAGSDGLFAALDLPPAITWAVAGVVAFAGFRLVKKLIK
jgi:hypothetical protein